MSGELTQPKVDQYIHWLSRDDHFGMHGCVYDDKSDKLLDEFFELIEQIAPVSKNGVRALWLRAERGPIEDYGNAEEEVACGDFDSVEEFIEEWKAWFPDEIKWYQLQAVQLKDEGYRAVMLGHKYVIVQDKRREPAGFPNEISEFVQWLIDGVKECIEMLKAGTYNGFIKENLPPEHRTGKILTNIIGMCGRRQEKSSLKIFPQRTLLSLFERRLPREKAPNRSRNACPP